MAVLSRLQVVASQITRRSLGNLERRAYGSAVTQLQYDDDYYYDDQERERIGGRINTSEFGGDRIEMGATWIHGIGGSPVHKIAQEINALESAHPWECMDGSSL
ncbi:hypothetical protein ACFX2J_045778 [Malus domestica]